NRSGPSVAGAATLAPRPSAGHCVPQSTNSIMGALVRSIRMRLRICAIGLGLALGVCISARAQDHSALNGFWEARAIGDDSGGFSDAFGKVPKAPLRSDIKPLPRIMNAGAVYGGKMPVDGS